MGSQRLPVGVLVRINHYPQGINLFLPAEIARIKRIMESLTSFEAAEVIGIRPETLCNIARSGKIEAIMTPDGWRIMPEAAAQYRQRVRPPGLTQSQAVAILGVEPHVLDHAAEKGVIPYTRGGGKHNFYDEATIWQIKNHRETLRGEFSRVPATIRHRRYTARTVANLLGTSLYRVSALADANLLPHFITSLPGNNVMKEYVAAYVDVLAYYAQQQGAKVTRDFAAAIKHEVEKGAIQISP